MTASDIRVTAKKTGPKAYELLVDGDVVGTAAILGHYLFAFTSGDERIADFHAPRLGDVRDRVLTAVNGGVVVTAERPKTIKDNAWAMFEKNLATKVDDTTEDDVKAMFEAACAAA